MHNTARHPDTVTVAHVCAVLLHSASLVAREWTRRLRTRRQLRELDARALADIGIDEGKRRAECAKPFWER
jgi:uncharacterized protein YjiS (DUF1127 family)